MNQFWTALFNGALLSSVATAAVWLGLRFTPRGFLNAATRYAIWWLVMVFAIISPVFESAMSRGVTRQAAGIALVIPAGVEGTLPQAAGPAPAMRPRFHMPFEIG